MNNNYNNQMGNQDPNMMNQQFYNNQQFNNQGGQNIPNTGQSNNPKNNNSILIIIGIIAVLVIGIGAFCLGSSLSNNDEKNSSDKDKVQEKKEDNKDNKTDSDKELTLYKTVSSKDLADLIGTDSYKEYLNKKITITDLEVSISDDTTILKVPGLVSYFYVLCDNVDSLEIKDGDAISITGIVEDSAFTNSGTFRMKSCSVSK